jgi:pimeloyl-ACP methyl ester carboxylesterase
MAVSLTQSLHPEPNYDGVMKRWMLIVLLALSAPWALAQPKDCAMVVMHGKWGNPQYIAAFGRRMEPACDFESIEMPWSGRRNYDAPYPVALQEIAAQVQKFRTQGYKKVLLAGHSFGANAALAYMTVHDDVDGILLLAPGHTPGVMAYQMNMNRGALLEAQQLIEQGHPDTLVSFDDLNQGKFRNTKMRADAVWTYFDPQGLGNMQLSAKRFKKAVPVFLAIGTRDPLFRLAKGNIFDVTPAHAASQYVELDADHGSTPGAAGAAALAWIQQLP